MWFPYIKNKSLISDKSMNLNLIKLEYYDEEIEIHDDFELILIYNDIK